MTTPFHNPDSVTIQNLEAAFAGESMAHIKYLWFARQCRKAGDEASAKVFEDTQPVERARSRQAGGGLWRAPAPRRWRPT